MSIDRLAIDAPARCRRCRHAQLIIHHPHERLRCGLQLHLDAACPSYAAKRAISPLRPSEMLQQLYSGEGVR